MPEDRDQIRDVMADEKTRGKRPRHSELRLRKLKKLFVELLERGTEEEFEQAMRDLGLSADSAQYGVRTRFGTRIADLRDRRLQSLHASRRFFRRKSAKVFFREGRQRTGRARDIFLSHNAPSPILAAAQGDTRRAQRTASYFVNPSTKIARTPLTADASVPFTSTMCPIFSAATVLASTPPSRRGWCSSGMRR